MLVGGGDLYGFSVGGVAVRWSLMKGGVLGRLASPHQFSSVCSVTFRCVSDLGLSAARGPDWSLGSLPLCLSVSLALWLVLHLYSLTHRSSIPTRDAQP